MNIDILNVTVLYACIVSGVIGGIAALLGSLMISKRMTLMAGALGHLALPGMALAFMYQYDVSLGAFLFLILGIFIIWLLEKKTKLPIESLTAVVFTSATALSFLFLPEEKTQAALLGDISQLTPFSVSVICIVSAGIFFCTYLIFRQILLITISSDLAYTRGIKVAYYNFIYLLCIAIMVALGVRVIGGLMTAALVAIPASASKNVTSNLFEYVMMSMILGIVSCIVGVFVSFGFGIPIGSAIILVSSLFFFMSLLKK